MTLALTPSSAVAITVQPADDSVPSDLKDLVPAGALPRPFLYETSNARAPCTYSELVHCLDGFAPSARGKRLAICLPNGADVAMVLLEAVHAEALPAFTLTLRYKEGFSHPHRDVFASDRAVVPQAPRALLVRAASRRA